MSVSKSFVVAVALMGCAASPSPRVATEPSKAQLTASGAVAPSNARPIASGDVPKPIPATSVTADDQDGDGVPNDVDRCPEAPEDHQCLYGGSGPSECCGAADGCPNLDPDEDGIAWPEDACPTEPEYWNDFKDDDGCPDGRAVEDARTIKRAAEKRSEGKIAIVGAGKLASCVEPTRTIVESNDIIILARFQFATGSARLQGEAGPIADAIAATMNGHPEFLWVEIAGYTDINTGGRDAVSLSLERAQVVVGLLVKRGVRPERIGPAGYGAFCPLRDGHHESNDRVDTKIVITADGLTGVQRGCARATRNGLPPPPVGTGR